MSKQVKSPPPPLGFAESFEAYAARLCAECTCGKHVVAWMHRAGCPRRAVYDNWSAHGKQAWARIKSLPGYVDDYAPVRREPRLVPEYDEREPRLVAIEGGAS